MIPEIGHFALIITLAIAIVQAIIPIAGVSLNKPQWMALARPTAWAQFLFVSISFACLLYAFITSDFSVKLVANNSHTQMPLIYKVSSLWGNHEGSLLLWSFILAGWGLAVSIFSRSIPPVMLARVMSVMGMVGIGFLLFLIMTSNPFERLPFPPAEGRTLNPLLQDFGLAVHPPMLYMGYVGFSVAFSFAIAAMLGGKLDAAWARWARPWTNIAWIFLTGGITLGSWWAYYELGWGGWWFWDPVENASFMPWLVATALVHSLSVSEKRGAFKHWTVLLAISGFSLSLLGTFLVRSGILTSVHSFASDPARGLFILIFLMIVVGGSLILYAWRATLMRSSNKFSALSRESGLLINNILLVAAMLSVFLGTLYPLLLDSLGLGKISVGAPYFDAVFIPIMIPAVLVMVIGPFLRWKKDSIQRVSQLLKNIWIGVAVLFLIALYLTDNIFVLLAVCLFIWIVSHSLVLLVQRLQQKGRPSSAFLGMLLAHIGIAVFLLGATVTTQYGVEKDLKMTLNETVEIKGYQFTFKGVEKFNAQNYQGHKGVIEVAYDGEYIATLKPEKRQYVTGMPMTEAAIDPSLYRDIYVALGEELDNNAWSLRLYYKPLIRLIWLGGIFIMFGALLAAFDRRYRLKVKS